MRVALIQVEHFAPQRGGIALNLLGETPGRRMREVGADLRLRL